ncbi:aurora kinase-like [Xyrichtys novacula]|uniref:non-specific serine/threonine protein kinase n=1 Tax=Xyrichtys novacula TaxID=13765 RepID=A0AAV1FZR4_XYRNO|nr:aurora kinase-like [Xyrichtys novacula]
MLNNYVKKVFLCNAQKSAKLYLTDQPVAGWRTEYSSHISNFTESGDASIFQSGSGSTGSRKRKLPQEEEDTRKRKRTSTPNPSEEGVVVNSRKRKASEEQVRPSKKRRQEEASWQEFETKYCQQHPLREGGFGSVYAGFRRADLFPVAIKHISRENVISKGVSVNGKVLPAEVAFMLRIRDAEGSVSLLDFYDLDQELILVLERLDPCADLLDYITDRGGFLQEEDAKIILKQVVKAARELQTKRIFHRDIKIENILIGTGTAVPQAKLIDFGLSCITTKKSTYSTFYGTSAHIPPEWYRSCKYRAGPTTVWQLGVCLTCEVIDDLINDLIDDLTCEDIKASM